MEDEPLSMDQIAELFAAKGYILFLAETPIQEKVIPLYLFLKGDVSPNIGVRALKELLSTGQMVQENGILRATSL